MAYEQAPFGDGSASGSGNVTTAVNTQYGRRQSGKTVGRTETDGFVNELVLDIDGEILTNAKFPLLAPTLPKNAIVEDVYMEVTAAFNLGGTGPVIDVGTEGSEAINGFTITEIQAETVGTHDLTSALSGTWATGLAADTTVGIALTGADATTTTAGKARIVIRYVKV